MKRICVYSGSNLGLRSEYKENAKLLGKILAELSDGFIVLPGGLGTFEELFEALSWAQLGIHKKPTGILNISNFFDPLLHMIKNTCTEGFANESNIKLISVSDTPLELIKQMKNYVSPIMENK